MSKNKLKGFDELFGPDEAISSAGQICEVPISDLYEFKGHPFKVLDDEKMLETVESIQSYGVLIPGIVRERANGGYEIIAGHRRKRAVELAGQETMPVIIRDYTDDEATIIMVDTNIQRENILPSEKAKAYSMKYSAIKHQGKKGGKALKKVGEKAGESEKTVQRYIWLARLSDELLDMVDNKKIGFTQGVNLSFLKDNEQEWVQVIIEETGVIMSKPQSEKIKEYSKSGELSLVLIREILNDKKSKGKRVVIEDEEISSYFSSNYSEADMKAIIIQLLQEWKAKNHGSEADEREERIA